MNFKSGRLWPYAIGISITMVFFFCVATIVVTQKANLQESDTYMTYYQNADANANELITAEINFNKKYKIEYITKEITKENAVLEYKITDLNNKPVNNAKIIVSKNRPESSKYNETLENASVENGVYSFENVAFPVPGIWNIIAKVEVENESRFFNVKIDTKTQEVYEFFTRAKIDIID